MFWTRVKSILVFIPLTILMIFIGGIPYYIFIAAVLGVAAWEFWRLFKTMGFNPSIFVIESGVLLFVLHRILFGIKYADILISVILFGVALYALIRYQQNDEDAAVNFGLHLTVILILGWVGSYFITMRSMPDGRWWLLLALPITWLADTGGYTFGKFWGRTKMAPRLSPKKSWAGFVGEIVFGMLAGVLLSLLWHIWMPTMLWWHGLVMGAVLSVTTILGDLLISLFKRTARVKDTSNLIPGHGGILDRIDTWIWAALIGYYTTLFLMRL